MARPKGDGRGRLGGRKKGTPHKMLASFCADTYDDFVEAYARILNPKERCEIWLKAQQFVTPRLNAVDVDLKNTDNSFQSELERMADEENK